MELQLDWEKTIRRMEQLMRLKSFPVALKFLEHEEDLGTIPYLRRMDHKVTFCQLITLARNFDWTVGVALDDFMNRTCPSILGLADVPDFNKDGTFRSIVWVKTKADGRKYEDSIPRIPLGKYKAVALAPAVYNPFEPDMILIYANPAQMMLLINALQFEDYEVMQFFCVGESSCSDAIARCHLTGKPSLTIPCYGERRYGHAQDDDLVMAVPTGMMQKALNGLEGLYRRGVRYPISFAGAEMDPTCAFPASYGMEQEVERIRGKDGRLVLGVTGGIASGKTTIAHMLKELGAPIIDFDLLARRVVEPGTAGWKDIVDYFGRQVLREDDTLDRKKLSKIVFGDLEKRKKLEGFTHPRIHAEFLKQLDEISGQTPGAIIQAVIPLLLELNMQYMFHKILVVCISPEAQIKRLAKRDAITKDEAANILKAQLPINEKVSYADYVIDNSGSMEDARRQVAELWDTLKRAQQDMAENKNGQEH